MTSPSPSSAQGSLTDPTAVQSVIVGAQVCPQSVTESNLPKAAASRDGSMRHRSEARVFIAMHLFEDSTGSDQLAASLAMITL